MLDISRGTARISAQFDQRTFCFQTSLLSRGKPPTPSTAMIAPVMERANGKARVPTEFGKESEALASQTSGPPARWYIQVARAFRQDPRLWFGVVLLVYVIAAIFAPLISPYPPLAYHPSIATQAPSLAHLFGTDSPGRDQLSRVNYGTRISLSVGIVTILLGASAVLFWVSLPPISRDGLTRSLP